MDRGFYESLDILERERSRLPRGYKHFSTDEIYEDSMFNWSLTWYKIKRLLFGVKEGEKYKHNKKYDIDYVPIIRKVIYIDEEYKPE